MKGISEYKVVAVDEMMTVPKANTHLLKKRKTTIVI